MFRVSSFWPRLRKICTTFGSTPLRLAIDELSWMRRAIRWPWKSMKRQPGATRYRIRLPGGVAAGPDPGHSISRGQHSQNLAGKLEQPEARLSRSSPWKEPRRKAARLALLSKTI